MIRRLAVLAAVIAAAGCYRHVTAPLVATSISVTLGEGQTAVAGGALPVQPEVTVKDQNGRAMVGAPLVITVVAGGGSITGAPTTTSASGNTPVGVWLLGRTTGVNQLRVTSGNANTAINAFSVSGDVSRITLVSGGTGISGVVGFPLTASIVLRFTDQFDNPAQGVAPTVQLPNGGSVAYQFPVTDGLGSITITRWTLGTIAGTQTMTISAGTATPVTVQATARAGAVQAIVPNITIPMQALPGAPTSSPLAVRAVDAFGNAVNGVVVGFSVRTGGGSITGATSATTNANGVATGGTWNLGLTFVQQQILVSASGFSTIITGQATSAYRATVRYGATVDPMVAAVVQGALDRLRMAIVGQLSDEAVTVLDVAVSCGITGAPVLTETVRDIVFYVQVAGIDGPGGAVVQPNLCLTRANGNGIVTAITIDDADWAVAVGDGSLLTRVLREMIRGVGFGGGWTVPALITGSGGADPRFTGAFALAAYTAAGGTSTVGVPVENVGAVGVRDVFWRSALFGDELMAGTYVVGQARPFSAITLQSLRDLGLTVNAFAVEPFSFQVPAAVRR